MIKKVNHFNLGSLSMKNCLAMCAAAFLITTGANAETSSDSITTNKFACDGSGEFSHMREADFRHGLIPWALDASEKKVIIGTVKVSTLFLCVTSGEQVRLREGGKIGGAVNPNECRYFHLKSGESYLLEVGPNDKSSGGCYRLF